jgi:hypothetical protein
MCVSCVDLYFSRRDSGDGEDTMSEQRPRATLNAKGVPLTARQRTKHRWPLLRVRDAVIALDAPMKTGRSKLKHLRRWLCRKTKHRVRRETFAPPPIARQAVLAARAFDAGGHRASIGTLLARLGAKRRAAILRDGGGHETAQDGGGEMACAHVGGVRARHAAHGQR